MNLVLIFSLQIVYVTPMVQQVWNVEKTMVNVFAKWDLQESNVKNVGHLSLVTSVINVNQGSTTIHLVMKVCLNHLFSLLARLLFYRWNQDVDHHW